MTLLSKARYTLANWISGGELEFHQQTAVKALAEAQRARDELRHFKRATALEEMARIDQEAGLL